MKKLKILKNVIVRTKAHLIIGLFLVFVLVVALILCMVEPKINNYFDALWYCYVDMFTIGFGDIVPVTFIGRAVSVLLTIYATVVIALVTGVIVSFYNEALSHHYKESRELILDKLANLKDLSREELIKLSDEIKKHKK